MIDFDELAAHIEMMREAFRAMVAGLVADGFTDEQARALVVAIMTNKTDEVEQEEGPPEAYSCRCNGDPRHPRSERCGP